MRRHILKKLINPVTQVELLPDLCQVVFDSLLYCRFRMQLRLPKVDQSLDLLLSCKKALVQLLSHEESRRVILKLARLHSGESLTAQTERTSSTYDSEQREPGEKVSGVPLVYWKLIDFAGRLTVFYWGS